MQGYLLDISPILLKTESATLNLSISTYLILGFIFSIAFMSIAIYNMVYVKKRILRTREDLLKSFDEDKASLSKELHDVVGSFLVPLKAETELMSEEKKKKWDDRIFTFKKFIKQTSHTIYPEYIYNNDLYSALKKLGDFISTDATQVKVHLLDEFEMNDLRGNHCFKIILELLTNIIKHDQPESIVVVAFSKKKNLSFTINFTAKSSEKPDIASKERSLGLRIIEQRLIFLKGTIRRTYEGDENQILVSIPK